MCARRGEQGTISSPEESRVNSRLGPVSELTTHRRFSGSAEPRLQPRARRDQSVPGSIFVAVPPISIRPSPALRIRGYPPPTLLSPDQGDASVDRAGTPVQRPRSAPPLNESSNPWPT